MSFKVNFMIRYRNARLLIKQIKAGEWNPHFIKGCCYYAQRQGLALWLNHGAFFCEIEDVEPNMLGYFWRHYVWWAAARTLKKEADKNAKKVYIVPQLPE